MCSQVIAALYSKCLKVAQISADESLCESLNFINSRTVDLSIKGALCVYLRRIFKYNILKQIYRLYKTAGSHIN